MKMFGKAIWCILALAVSASATNYTVMSNGGGNYTTIQSCASAMSSGDTCTVYAGTYNEHVTVPAGAKGAYNTITVNGSDVVKVYSFSLNSHTKIVGNCPLDATLNSCGFTIGNASSPNNACVSLPSNATDYYVTDNTMYACGPFISEPGSGSNVSYGYIQGNTMSYSCSTSNSPNVCTAMQIHGDYHLIENNYISHVSDGPYFGGAHNVMRKNVFGPINSSDCGSNSSNCHIDFMQADSNVNGGGPATTYLLLESNSVTNATGSDIHAVGLFQGEACAGKCFNAIVRFHKAYHASGSGVVDDNSETSCPAWDHVKVYNNDWIDMGASGGGATNNTSYCSTNAAYLNDIYYWPGAVNNFNPYFTVGGGGSSASPFTVGSNLAFCGGGGCTSLHGHTYGSGNFTDDSGNQIADPKFVNYSGNNFALSADSPAIGAATYLTTVLASDAGSGNSLKVSDADYFQAGSPLDGVQSDCIAIDTLANHACITSVNYSTGVLTLANSITRTPGTSKVYLYSISDGTIVWTNGQPSPDLGAIPYASSTSSQPAPPTGLSALVN